MHLYKTWYTVCHTQLLGLKATRVAASLQRGTLLVPGRHNGRYTAQQWYTMTPADLSSSKPELLKRLLL
jgi:hypothetical protein